MAKLPLTLTHVLEMRGEERGRDQRKAKGRERWQMPGWDSKETGGREREWSDKGQEEVEWGAKAASG